MNGTQSMKLVTWHRNSEHCHEWRQVLTCTRGTSQDLTPSTSPGLIPLLGALVSWRHRFSAYFLET